MEYLNVNFLGSEIMVINHDGEPYVAMHTVVNGMGLTWQPQHRKLTSNQRWGGHQNDDPHQWRHSRCLLYSLA